MEVKLTGPKTLVLQSEQIAYILDTLSSRPYREVTTLIDNLFFQLRQQEDNVNEPKTSDSTPGRGFAGVPGSGTADR